MYLINYVLLFGVVDVGVVVGFGIGVVDVGAGVGVVGLMLVLML